MPQPNKLIKLCGLYENVSKATGKTYFIGNLSFTSKLLLLRNEDAKDGEPGWSLFLAEREPKQPQPARTPQASRSAPDTGGLDGGDYPKRHRYQEEAEF